MESSARGKTGPAAPHRAVPPEARDTHVKIVDEMLRTHPAETDVNRGHVAAAVDALLDCVAACTACADACLFEQDVEMLRACIRLNLDCADVCAATARVLSRQSADDTATSLVMLGACIQACQSCADECTRHAEMHEHCQVCAAACVRCERACSQVREAMLQPAAASI